jgi:hypothetical protein
LNKVFVPREAAPHVPKTPKQDARAAKQADVAAIGGVSQAKAPDLSVDTTRGVAEDVANAKVVRDDEAVGFTGRFKAGFQNNSLLSAITRAWDEQDPEADKGFARDYYIPNMAKIEEGATDDEVHELREATSMQGLDQIKLRIDERRERNKRQYSGGNAYISKETSGLIYGLTGGLVDPVGLVAGVGVGKVFQMAGVGSRALWASGKSAAAVGSLAVEGAVGNVAITAGLDMLGERVNAEQYAAAAGFGLILGVLPAPLVLHGGRADTTVLDAGRSIQRGAQERRGAFVDQAEKNVGTENPALVQEEAERLANAEPGRIVKEALSPVPARRRMVSEAMSNDESFTEASITSEGTTKPPEPLSPAVQDVTDRYDLGSISAPGERAMAADMTIQAEALLAETPINEKALAVGTKWIGQESTGIAMLSDPSPVAKALSISLLESTTGAAGRRPTAAMTQHMLEKLYNREVLELDSLFDLFRKQEGKGRLSEFYSGNARRAFDRRIMADIEGRGKGLNGDIDPLIIRAADLFEAGMNRMRIDQQTTGTVGFARLGDTSVGYVPHRLMPSVVAQLTPEQSQAIRKILSDQFVDEQNGFDREFADRLAAKYLENGRDKAMGGAPVPANLHDPQAADIVFDVAQALKLTPEQADKLMGKFSRGGAGHTKSRLKLDLSTEIPDGKGGTMQLMDLFDQDVTGLYRSYARRVSGEVALAQYGIMGKKGLSVAREAIKATGGQNPGLRAFDQIASEFLNTPFGEHNHNWMDNARLLTSNMRLGGMGFTQFGEYTNAVAALGVHRALSAIGGFRRLAREVSQLKKGGEVANPLLKDIDQLNGAVGMDDYQLSRTFDNKDSSFETYNGEGVGIATRALRAGGHIQAGISGQRMITAVQTRGMAEQIIRKAVAYAKSGADDVALDDMGIGPDLRKALNREMGSIAKFDSSGKLTELNMLAGNLTAQEIDDLRYSIQRGASQIIQRTYHGETGKWAHDGLLKLLFQFRTFSLISVEKQWGRNRVNYGALKASMYLMGAMSLAAPIHMARVQARMAGMSRKEREKYAEQNLSVAAFTRATMNYASASGALGDIVDIGTGMAGSWGGKEISDAVGARGQGGGKVTGLVPSLGMAEDAWAAIHGNPHKAAKLLPFGNLPYVQPIIAGITPDKAQ